MDDIPEDISNKKYVASPQVDVAQPVAAQQTMTQALNEAAPSPPDSNSANGKQQRVSGSKREKLRVYLKQKKKHFVEVQYPRLYAGFYDAYNFDIVGYKPLDNVLKILILITALILVVIFMIILFQLVKLAL